jgi:2-octaprenyl-6-methoxyphenol hydroxylase
MMQSRVDIAIVGGGPVGLALAAMLVARGVAPKTIAVLDAKPVDIAAKDPRSLALSFGSRQLLSQIQSWPKHATPITQIHVSRRGSFGRTLIDCDDYELPALGYVCRYGELVKALDASAPKDLQFHRPVGVTEKQELDDRVELRLSDGSLLTSSLLVQAEGGLFGEQATRSIQRDYEQVAIIATVQADAMPSGRAFERFTDEGPLALLPQDDSYAMVWCVKPASAESLLALDDQALLEALQKAFGQRVGRFTLVGARNAYALGLNAEPVSTARTMAIGNAAQTLHPVAGQGLNLGLRDASVLASMLSRDASPAMLSAFEHQRRKDRHTTVRITDLMARVFASAPDRTPTQSLLGLSLGMLDLLPPAKRLLAEQMMFGSR